MAEPADLGRDKFEKLMSIVTGDGAELRRQFILAGLLLTVFERFKWYVVDQVDGFFAAGFQVKDGDLTYTRGEKFKKLIQERGSPSGRQHNNKEFRAALSWFSDLKAISKEEFEEVERLYTIRNEIGHELLRIIADDGKNPLKLIDVLTAFSIYVKIVRWWIKEIEVATDPDLDPMTYENMDFEKSDSSETLFLRSIINKALAEDKEFQKLQDLMKMATDEPPPA
jgi:hypothetical protein